MSDTNPQHHISNKTPVKLPVGIWLFVIFMAFGAGGGFAVAQYQIAAHERRIERIEDERKSDRELLTRIDERTAAMKQQLDRLAK